MTVSNLARPIPATPPGARITNAQQSLSGLLATPFAIETQANISTLSVVTGSHDVTGQMTVALFAAGPNGRPTGAALGSATINLKPGGPISGALAATIDPPAGDYFAVTASRPTSLTGAPILQSVAGGDLAVADAIGSTNPAAPCSGIALPFVGTDAVNIAADTLTGAEPWQEITGGPGGPVVWLS